MYYLKTKSLMKKIHLTSLLVGLCLSFLNAQIPNKFDCNYKWTTEKAFYYLNNPSYSNKIKVKVENG
jgi:hypothetical protein